MDNPTNLLETGPYGMRPPSRDGSFAPRPRSESRGERGMKPKGFHTILMAADLVVARQCGGITTPLEPNERTCLERAIYRINPVSSLPSVP